MMVYRLGLSLVLCMLASVAVAAIDVGGIAHNVLGPVGSLTELVYIACYAIGGAMLMGAVIQYKAHRENPSQIRLSTPVILLILGLVLVFVPYLSRYSAASKVAGKPKSTQESLRLLNPSAVPAQPEPVPGYGGSREQAPPPARPDFDED